MQDEKLMEDVKIKRYVGMKRVAVRKFNLRAATNNSKD
jgi:hypothetical protein